MSRKLAMQVGLMMIVGLAETSCTSTPMTNDEAAFLSGMTALGFAAATASRSSSTPSYYGGGQGYYGGQNYSARQNYSGGQSYGGTPSRYGGGSGSGATYGMDAHGTVSLCDPSSGGSCAWR